MLPPQVSWEENTRSLESEYSVSSKICMVRPYSGSSGGIRATTRLRFPFLIAPTSRGSFKPLGLNNSATGNYRFPTPSLEVWVSSAFDFDSHTSCRSFYYFHCSFDIVGVQVLHFFLRDFLNRLFRNFSYFSQVRYTGTFLDTGSLAKQVRCRRSLQLSSHCSKLCLLKLRHL